MLVPVRFEGSVCSRSLRRRGLPFGVVARFVQPFQPAAPVIPPAGRTPVPVPQHSEVTRLTTRSSERRGSVRREFLAFSPAVAELGSVRPRKITGLERVGSSGGHRRFDHHKLVPAWLAGYIALPAGSTRHSPGRRLSLRA